MPNIKIENKIDRRQFLKGAATAVLAPSLMTSALSKCLTAPSKPIWKAAFWNGERFVGLDHMSSSSLSGSVRVEVSGAGDKSQLRGVNLSVPIANGDPVPFHAWTANSPAPTRFTAHAHPEGFAFEIVTKEGNQEVLIPAVRPGTYVFARSLADIDRVASIRGLRGEASDATVPYHVLVEISTV
jgi:hypothetical protein